MDIHYQRWLWLRSMPAYIGYNAHGDYDGDRKVMTSKSLDDCTPAEWDAASAQNRGRRQEGNPYYESHMRRCMAVCDAKSHDYARSDDKHSNFRYAATVAAPFPEWAKPYATLVGVKLARLAELLNGKVPKHETVGDSFGDLTNYTGLWAARWAEDMDKGEM